jgi:hypothetical protein
MRSRFADLMKNLSLLAVAALLVVAAPAFAQDLEGKINNLGVQIINLLTVAASVVGGASIVIAGMKYFSGDPQAREQVKHIVIGAIFSFAAAGIIQTLKGALQ